VALASDRVNRLAEDLPGPARATLAR